MKLVNAFLTWVLVLVTTAVMVTSQFNFSVPSISDPSRFLPPQDSSPFFPTPAPNPFFHTLAPNPSGFHFPSFHAPQDPNAALQGHFIVCLYNSKRYYKLEFTPSMIDPKLCTHVNYEFAKLHPTDYFIMEGDPYLDVEKGFYKEVVGLKKISPSVKVLLSIGGWEDSGKKYSDMMADETKMTNFINHAISFLKDRGFDGMDFAFEYPNAWQGAIGINPKDKDNLVTFLKATKKAFKDANLVLSMSVSAIKREIDAGYNIPGISGNVDHINVMTYDIHGPWESKTGHHTQFEAMPGDSDPYANVKAAAKLWADGGADKRKINVGVAFYGKTYTLANPSVHSIGAPTTGVGAPVGKTNQGGMAAYNELCQFLSIGNCTGDEDPFAGFYVYCPSSKMWACYDPPMMVVKKAQWVIKEGYGGLLLKDMSCDDYEMKCSKMKFRLTRMIQREMISAVKKFG